MSDNPRPPRRPLGDRDEKDKSKPFGGRFGERASGDPRPRISPTDPYPWARDEAEEDPAPPRDQDTVAPTDPYPWAGGDEEKKPAPPPDPNVVPPTAPYPWANDEQAEKPAPRPDLNRTSPTAPYPWAKDEQAERPAPRHDLNRTPPTAPYPWAKDDPAETPAPPPDPNRTAPTAPYPWSDEAPPEVAAVEPVDEIDPRSLSWADLIAGVEQADAAPPEADLLDEAPLEPPLPSEAPHADRPRLSDATRSLPSEKEAPLERVTDRFLKRGAFLGRRATAIPARSYLEGDTAPAPQPIAIQVVPLLRTLGVILGSGLLIATLFTWWTPNSFLPSASAGQLAIAEATQGSSGPAAIPLPTTASNNVIGIVSGHKGINPSSGLPDPGAVCADGLTEESINATIATKTAQLLEAEGYHIDIFDEFDPRLTGYRALAMVSIHADSCEYINDEATGFKVASFQASTQPERDTKLVNCMIEAYAARTGLPLHPGVTFDMTDYHNFREIDSQTPGIIVETGFLYLDRTFLTSRPDDAAHGIADGVLCYLRGQPSTPTQPAPVITPTGSEAASPTPTVTLTPTDFGSLFDTATPVVTQLPLDQITPAP